MNQSFKVVDIQSLKYNQNLVLGSTKLINKEVSTLPQSMINTLSKLISEILKPDEELTINNQTLIKNEDSSLFMLVINYQTIILNVHKSVMSFKYRLSLEEKTLYFNDRPTGYDGKLKFIKLLSKILNSKNRNKFKMIISKKKDKFMPENNFSSTSVK